MKISSFRAITWVKTSGCAKRKRLKWDDAGFSSKSVKRLKFVYLRTIFAWGCTNPSLVSLLVSIIQLRDFQTVNSFCERWKDRKWLETLKTISKNPIRFQNLMIYKVSTILARADSRETGGFRLAVLVVETWRIDEVSWPNVCVV